MESKETRNLDTVFAASELVRRQRAQGAQNSPRSAPTLTLDLGGPQPLTMELEPTILKSRPAHIEPASSIQSFPLIPDARDRIPNGNAVAESRSALKSTSISRPLDADASRSPMSNHRELLQDRRMKLEKEKAWC